MGDLNTWKIQNITAGTPAVTFASLGLSGLKINRISRQISTATFVAKDLIDAPYRFAFNDFCVILNPDGIRWFAGNIVTRPGSASSSGEAVTYTIENPWRWLVSKIMFMQQWYGRSGYYPRVILGQGIVLPGGISFRKTCDQVIEEILDYAIYRGAPLQVGTITPGPLPPLKEGVSMWCAEGIKYLMRWMETVVEHWDYTTEPYPTINFYKRSERRRKSISIDPTKNNIDLQGLNIESCDEEIPPCVKLIYERKMVVTEGDDQQAQTKIDSDTYPEDATGYEPGALVSVIQLGGSATTIQKNIIKTTPIPQLDALDADVVAWAVNNCPELKGIVKPGHIAILPGDFSFTQEVDDDQKDPNGNTYVNFIPTDLPRQLDQGSNIAGWQAKPQGSVPATSDKDDGYLHAMQMRTELYLTINWETDASTWDQLEIENAQKIFGPGNAKRFSIEVTATDARSMVYRDSSADKSPESLPEGLAESLYRGLSQRNWRGTIALKERECSGLLGLDCVLNIKDSDNTDWAAMDAEVQAVNEDIDTGQTSVQIGPPDHLGVQDKIELLRATYTHVGSQSYNERKDGKDSRTPEVDGTVSGSKIEGTKVGEDQPLPPWAPIDQKDGTFKVNPDSHLIWAADSTELTIANLGTAIDAQVGMKLYVQIPLTSDLKIDASRNLKLTLDDHWPVGYPVGENSTDPANKYQDWLWVKLLECVATTDERDGALWMLAGGGIVKIVSLCKTNLVIKAGQVVDMTLIGLLAFPTEGPGV